MMKVCMIGLGSIGGRHLKNLKHILSQRGIEVKTDALRSSARELSGDISGQLSETYYSVEELPDDYDLIFVTNPTSVHFDTIRAVLKKTKHMFIEKPVFSDTDVDPSDLCLVKDSGYYVACPLRYKTVLQKLKDIVSKESVFSVRAICSSYLPDWRKGIDYRTVYSARKELGGGVVLDLIHEWDYLRWLFGDPLEITLMKGKVSDLEIDTEDLAVYLARYPDKLLELHLDYFGRKAQRAIEIYCRDHIITADLINDRLIWSDKTGERIEQLEQNDFYLDDMNHFLDMVLLGVTNDNPIEWAYETLKIAKGDSM